METHATAPRFDSVSRGGHGDSPSCRLRGKPTVKVNAPTQTTNDEPVRDLNFSSAGDTMMSMRSRYSLVLALFLAIGFFVFFLPFSLAQSDPGQSTSEKPGDADHHAERNAEAQESSSRDTKIDISPPKDDAKNHPHSASAMEGIEEKPASDGVQEFHPWNPLKALNDVEVGDFYFKRKNYRAAQDRYKEALYYKQNDAIATFRLAQCQEKLGSPSEALSNYEAYLRILPEGPLAADAQKAIERLSGAPGEPYAKKN